MYYFRTIWLLVKSIMVKNRPKLKLFFNPNGKKAH